MRRIASVAGVRLRVWVGMQSSYQQRHLTGWLAAAVTVTAFAKTFVPFYLIGSTAIFVGTSAVGIALAAASWRRLRDDARQIPGVLVVFALLYVLVVVNFLTLSRSAVP